MKKIALIGSTGSIGRQVCSVVRRHKDKYKIESLVANSSAEAFLKQAEEFRPSYAVLADERAAAEIKDKIPEGVRFAWGEGRGGGSGFVRRYGLCRGDGLCGIEIHPQGDRAEKGYRAGQ